MHIINPAKTVVPVLVFVLFLVVPNNTAQQLSRDELDSLYSKFIQVRAPYLLEQPEELTAEERKCGLEIVNRVKFNLNSFSVEQHSVLKPLLQRPVMQTSIVSPSGFFRIHYDTTGFSVPSYISSASIETNIQEVVKTLDSTYSFEVDYLGYPAPPPDGNEGGDNLYDVYIINQPSGLYGFTQFENEIEPGSQKYTSYLVMDNNYTGYFSEGVNGLRVTAAHEFHHAIQGGNYIFRASDTYFYEITSTAFEEFVYDDVNDYLQYLSSYFAHPDRPMPQQNGYNMAIWNIYLKERFGFEILKLQWELMPDFRAITSINNSIINKGSAFPRELNKFGIWTYFTNYRTIPGTYFKEAVSFPLITPTGTIQFTPPSEPVHMTANPITNNFIKFILTSSSDTLVSIVSNGDASSAITELSQDFNFDYELFNNPNSGERKLTDEYSSIFSTANPTFWSVSEILNRQIVREDTARNTIIKIEELFVFPNPFYYRKHSENYISITFDTKAGEKINLHVFSSGMKQIFSAELDTRPISTDDGKTFSGVVWDGLDNDRNKLASGVYIYVIKKGDDIVKGKVVIFNE